MVPTLSAKGAERMGHPKPAKMAVIKLWTTYSEIGPCFCPFRTAAAKASQQTTAGLKVRRTEKVMPARKAWMEKVAALSAVILVLNKSSLAEPNE